MLRMESHVKYLKTNILTILIIVLFLTACAKENEEIILTGDDSDPNHLSLSLEKTEYSNNEEVKLTIDYSFYETESVSADLNIWDSETLQGNFVSLYKSDVMAKESSQLIVEFNLSLLKNKTGYISTVLSTYDEHDNILYGNVVIVAYYKVDEIIYLGFSSPYSLKLEHIKSLYEKGDISRKEYERLLKDLQREGNLKD